jgi:hypothetical protein
MKIKLLLTATAVAGLAVSSAVAAPPAGKGKPTTGEGCKPKVAVVLKGTLASTPGASATALSVNVASGNRWARAYVNATQPTSVAVDPTKVKVRRKGKKTLADLLMDDRVVVKARVCKADLKDDATPALTAWSVVAHPAKAESEADDD